MNRTEQALATLRAEPGRAWTSIQMSVALNCAPSQARGALLRLVGTGCAAVTDDGLFRLPDAPPPAPDPVEAVFALLSPARELTPFGISDLHPDLGMGEDEVLGHLFALARARRIDLWASLPTFEEQP